MSEVVAHIFAPVVVMMISIMVLSYGYRFVSETLKVLRRIA
jgi:hypothetical protein